MRCLYPRHSIIPPRRASPINPKLLTFASMSSQRILMVCLGNICRSPLAEGILREKVRATGLDWVVDSAGTNGYHTGEAPHPLSQKVARQHGIDISGQRARRFTAADFQRFDKIYAMAEDVLDDMRRIAGRAFEPAKVDLLLNEVHPGSNEDVPDPWYGPEPGYHEVYALIDAAADKIIAKYGQPYFGQPNFDQPVSDQSKSGHPISK
jgi:protein-tyrosine phosphatase